MAQVIPEILSRFCCKCTTSRKNALLIFLKKMYSSPYKNKYDKVSDLLKRLLNTLSSNEKYQLLPELLEIPFPDGVNGVAVYDYTNPIEFLEIDKTVICTSKKPKIDKTVIEDLFILAFSEMEIKRKWGTTTLVTLYGLDLLTKANGKKLGSVLW